MKHITPILLTLVLTACGGGGGGGSGSDSSTTPSASAVMQSVLVQQHTNTIYNTASGDLNGDGLDDVVVSGWNLNGAAAYVWVFTQNADGTLTDSTATLLPTNTHAGTQHVFVADFDGDGKNDIFLPGFSDGTTTVAEHSIMYWGTGSNTPFTAYTFPELVTAHGACIDDINSDGRMDMIVGDGGIYYNQGSRTFTLDTTVLHGNNYFSACAVTHQTNGDINIVLGNNNAVVGFKDNINIYNSNMVFQSAIGLAQYTAGTGDLVDVIAVDINGDGAKDLVTRYNSNSARDVWISTSNNTYTYNTTLDTLGNDYYSYTVTVNNQPMILFPGNAVGTRLYQINNGLTVYRPTAFTDMNLGRTAQSAAVYRNASTGKSFMLQLLDSTFYSKEIK
jgi:hypothetical protein